MTSINLLLANGIEDRLPLNVFICDLRVLARKPACPFDHPTQVSTQVQLASTCDYLPVRLTRALHFYWAGFQRFSIGKPFDKTLRSHDMNFKSVIKQVMLCNFVF